MTNMTPEMTPEMARLEKARAALREVTKLYHEALDERNAAEHEVWRLNHLPRLDFPLCG